MSKSLFVIANREAGSNPVLRVVLPVVSGLLRSARNDGGGKNGAGGMPAPLGGRDQYSRMINSLEIVSPRLFETMQRYRASRSCLNTHPVTSN